MTDKIAYRLSILFSLFGLFAVVAPALSHAGGVALASHRAVYDLTLKEFHRDGGIEDVRGRIVMEVENSCEGVLMNQRMLVELLNISGDSMTSDYHLSTWEDRAGQLMRFTMSNVLNGRTIENYDGVANLGSAGGSVTFSEDGADRLDLPEGVIFPTGHTREILKSAKAGKNLLSAKIYDGNGVNGLFDTLTVIGKSGKSDSTLLKDRDMGNLPYWPVQMSYFDLSAQSNEPEFEVGLKMFENGVASDLVLKYEDFSLNGSLVQLDILDTAGCGN